MPGAVASVSSAKASVRWAGTNTSRATMFLLPVPASPMVCQSVLAGAIEAITDKRVDQSDHACPDGRTREDIRMTWFVRILARALALVVAIVGTPAMAQDYPTRPVTIVVGYTPGATSDLLARTVGERLNAAWGQSVI